MKKLIVTVTMLITASLVSAFWLDYHANLQEKTKDLCQQIDDLLQERYEQRMEIATYHRQEARLWQEITRLKGMIKTRETDPINELASVREIARRTPQAMASKNPAVLPLAH